MNNLRIDKRKDGVYLTCDRGMVAQMLAGYSQTQEEDARILAAAPSLLAALKKVALIAKNLSAYGEVDQAITHDLNVLILPAIAKAERN